MDINKLHKQIKNDISGTTSLRELNNVHIKHFGREGTINTALHNIINFSIEERRNKGKEINSVKIEGLKLEENQKNKLIQSEESTALTDITLPGKPYPQGSLHLVTLAIEEISKIFEKIGFIRMTYPEVEWEFFSFDALNMPPEHPARDDFETLFIDEKPHPKSGRMLLTPHTSSGQYREMKRLDQPPIRMINIGKTYRPNWDATHTPMFHQFEGLCVDKDINITHLKGTIDYFAKEFFGENREIRLRPFHFQFTEPSFEVDITCGICLGTGKVNGEKCKLCKSGWLELGGAGMVHPNVLKAGGIDANEYTGWAFGWGVERVMMMKPNVNIDNMRLLYDGDVRVLEQF